MEQIHEIDFEAHQKNQQQEKNYSFEEEKHVHMLYSLIKDIMVSDVENVIKLLENTCEIKFNEPEQYSLWKLQQLLIDTDIVRRDLTKFYIAAFLLEQNNCLHKSKTVRLRLNKNDKINTKQNPKQVAFLLHMLVQTLPLDSNTLDLAESYGLCMLGVAGLKQILRAIPPHITSLNLYGIALYHFGIDGLKQVFQAVPPHITSLNLRMIGLDELGTEGIKEVLNVLHLNIQSLNLSGNHLCEYDFRLNRFKIDRFEEVLQTLRRYPSINTLDLSGNCLSNLGVDGIKQMLHILPSSIHSLNLAGNDLCNLGIDGLKQIFQTLHQYPNIKSLDLGNNDLYRFGVHGLKEILQALPSNIRFLGLTGNFMFELTSDYRSYGPLAHKRDITDVFQNIPAFRMIDLRYNSLDESRQYCIKRRMEGDLQKQALSSGGLKQLTGRLVWKELERGNIKRLKQHHIQQNENDNCKVATPLGGILPKDLEEFVEQQTNFGVQF